MSTQPQLSPIEQLMGSQTSTPSAPPQGQGDLSPIEQLMQQPQSNDQSQTRQLTPAQQAARDQEGALSGMTGMPSPGLSDADTANFERGKRAGALTAGGAEVLSPLVPATGELADLAIKHLAGNVLPGMETEAAKQTLLKAIPTVKQLVGWGLSYEGLKHLFGAVSGSKK